MRVLVIAGGTGGHIYPALSIAKEFKQIKNEIFWIGKRKSLEEKICNDEGFNFFPIKATGFLGKGFMSKLKSLYFLFLGFRICFDYMKDIRPDLIISTGGYMSLAPGLVGSFFCPLIIHEQNSVPGLANRILSTRSTVIFEAFKGAFKGKRLNASWVGNPVREKISSYKNTKKKLNENFNILVLGGSQGSKQLNEILCKAFENKKTPDSWRITHQVGKLDTSLLRKSYENSGAKFQIEDFIHDMGKVYSEADIIISRAGAMTLSEICELSKPSILLPLPWSADDHQYKNALYLQNLGAAILIESDLQNSKKLFELLISIEKEHNRRESMAFAAGKAFPESSSKLIYKKIHESLKI